MKKETIKGLVQSEINGFLDDNAKQYAAVSKLTLAETTNGWIVFDEPAWLIGYSLADNWRDTPWFFSAAGPDDPHAFCPTLEACFQMLIYPPYGTPPPEAQATIDANRQALERLRRKSQERNKKKRGRQSNGQQNG